MKNCLLTAIILLCSILAKGQCYPTPITSATGRVMVGDTAYMYNSLSGGVWSVLDTNVAIISPTSGRVVGKRVDTTTVTYFMPGACRLFYSQFVLHVTPGIQTPDHIVAGNTYTLTDSSTTGGNWTSADTNIAVVSSLTGSVRGITPGMVTITCTFSRFGTNCIATKAVKITKGINGRRKLGLGDMVTYSDTATGGIWTTADTTIAAVDAATGVVRAKALGMTYITYTNVIGGRTCTANDTIWVNWGIVRKGTICVSDVYNYVDTVTGGTWTSSAPAVASINSTTGVLHSNAAGTTVISYVVTTAGVSYLITDSLAVVAAPAIPHISALVLCPYSADTLRCGGSPVSWSSSDPTNFYISAGDSVYTAMNTTLAPAYATLRYTSSICSYLSDSTPVTLNPAPLPGYISGGRAAMCTGDTATFWNVGASETGGTWAVTSSSGTISSTGVFSALSPGLVFILHTVTNSYGCASSTGASQFITPPSSGAAIAGVTTLNIGLIGNYTSTGFGDSTSWSVSPTSLASISNTGQLTPLSVGTVTVKVFYYTHCGIDSTTRVVTITLPATGGVSSVFTGFVNSLCASPEFGVSVFAHTATYKLRTYYGDGSNDSITLAPTSATAITRYYHGYPNSGSYTIKQVLYNGSSAIDSVTYSYMHIVCNVISLSFYLDVDHDCNYTASVDHVNYNPMLVVVDSNGVSIDTLSVTSGIYYEEWGAPGSVYAFRLLSPAAVISCPSSGIVYDTISTSSTAVRNKGVAFTCTGSGFDVSQVSAVQTGRHHQQFSIHVGNRLCAGEDGSVFLVFDGRYNYQNATPTPSAITSSYIRWDFTNISEVSGTHPDISVGMETPGGTGGWLTPGTVINNTIYITPATTGDLDTSNNTTYRNDTVKSSFDPNFVQVSPSGNIIGGTNLHYTIQFENDGNDTARNIYVMDTLPDYVNVNSLRIVMATARMNTSITRAGGHNIVKFDFPNIMLPDSTHHNHCTGSVMFNVKANYGVATGTHIDNHAGIFFDDNPVVLTDTAYNTMLIPAIAASSTCRDTLCHGGILHCAATYSTVNTPHYQWYVNTTPVGTDSVGFTSTSVVSGDNVKCVMRTIMDDTVFTTSNILHITERALPDAGVIHGSAVVCPAASITLTDSVGGGTWTLSNTRASIAGSVVTGITPGNDTAIYTVTNICYPNSARFPFSIHTLSNAGTITGPAVFCDTASVNLTDAVSGGSWFLANAHASISATGRATGISGGYDTAYYVVSNVCDADTATFPLRIDSIVHLTTPAGPSVVCQSSTITLTGTISGGAWTVSNSHASVSTAGIVTGTTAGIDTVIYTIANTCGTFTSRKSVTVNTTVVPAVTLAVSPSASICERDSVHIATTAVNGGSAPVFMWQLLGATVATGSTFGYVPAIGDIVVCKMTSDALCRTADTVATTATMAVTPSVTPVISIVSTPSDSVAYSGQLITFYSTTTYGGSAPTYQWYVNNVAIAGATNISYARNVSSNDTVKCAMTSSITCVTQTLVYSNPIVIYADYLEVSNLISTVGNISLFPNPNHGAFTLSGKISGNEEVVFEIFEITGKLVYSGVAKADNGQLNEQLNLKNTLAQGSYLVKVRQGANVAVLHFVIE